MKVVEIAKVAHEVNRAYCNAIGDNSQPSWEDAPQWQKDSAIAGVNYHKANPDAKPSDSHESWLRQKEAEGWKFGPVKNPETKEHPCFVPYDQLPLEQKVKDYLFIAVVRSLLGSAGDGTSIGEQRVRTEFNPANDGLVDEIKQKTADLINLCASAALTHRDSRTAALAMTHFENAAMWAVKAATA